MTTECAAFDRASRDLRVFISNRESRCDDCGEDLGRRAMIFLAGNRGALCLTCADLDHLTFLPPGDAALTRRARKHSTLAAVVLKWSRARRRYERQGLLVEEQALQRAEAECLNDAEARARRRDREAERRAELDAEFVARFAVRIRQLYPGCPPDRPDQIASHACQKYSERIGRSAAANASTRRRCSGRSSRTCVTTRRTMTSCWRAVSSAGTRVIASVRMSTVCSHGGAKDDPAPPSEESESRNEKEKEQASQAGGRQANTPDQDDD
jgi:hypothetical protein